MGGWGYTVVNIELPFHNMFLFYLMTIIVFFNDTNIYHPFPHTHYIFLLSMWFYIHNILFFFRLLYNLEKMTAIELNICLHIS